MRRLRSWWWLLLAVPLVIGISRLRFDVEILNLLPSNSPIVEGLKLYQGHFSNARELIVTVKSNDPELTEKTARTLALELRKATNLIAGVAWQAPWQESPLEAAEMAAFLWLNQPPEIFGNLTNRLADAKITNVLEEAREQLTTSLSPNEIAFRGYDPYSLLRLPESALGDMASSSGGEFFSSADGTFRLLFVEAAVDLTRYRDCIRWITAIKQRVARARTAGEISSEVKINYTGRPAFVAEIAGAMESDLAGPSAGTLGVIALLFYISHRRWRPLLWLLVLLALVLGLTLSVGGLLFGTLNVVSLGFASILLGLAEDFAIVLYQESRTHPELSLQQIREVARPGIMWSAITTSGAFLLLNLSGLPGLGQLGSLVGIGIIIAAFVMLYAFLPPVLGKHRRQDDPAHDETGNRQHSAKRPALERWIVWISVATGGVLIVLLVIYPPRFDHSAEALRPRHSPAYAAVDEIKAALGRAQEPLWVIVSGKTEGEVLGRLATADKHLSQAVREGLISRFTLPTSIWPDPQHQAVNRATLKELLPQRGRLRSAALEFGFSTNALALTDRVFETWQQATETQGVYWPGNSVSHWILNKVVARDASGFLALGMLYTSTNGPAYSRTEEFVSTFTDKLQHDGIILSGWTILSSDMFNRVRREFPRVLFPILVLVFISLWLAYRNLRDVALSVLTLCFSGLCLFAIMQWLGWSWNLMNLMALPLLLGMGVDFSIHVQLALRRYHGDTVAVRQSVGRALLLAGSTTVAGFGSLVFSSNAGMVSLGLVCATGIVCSMLVAVYVLPSWWSALFGRQLRNPRP